MMGSLFTSSKESTATGTTPRTQSSCRTLRAQVLMAMMGHRGLYFAMTWAVEQPTVKQMINLACVSIEVSTAEDAIASTPVTIPSFMFSTFWRMFKNVELNSKAASAFSQMRRMIETALTGKAPLAVSPLSMTQSVPSKTALATSLASARVGLGKPTMDSNICVAVTTGLPNVLQTLIIIFCATKTFSGGISMPRSPRATMMPSLASQIAVKFFSPSSFSIFDIILIPAPAGPSVLRIKCTSSALWTKEAATKSTPCGIPKSMRSFTSFSCSTGSSTLTPGRLQFLRSPNLQLFITSVTT
mmetsp:Transcript_118287/g.307237  ORF Transcript_118287/g.307237 Transcript_118287/m.307237 type:complete len:300 (-) Transcript_118287:744-1643(-)